MFYSIARIALLSAAALMLSFPALAGGATPTQVSYVTVKPADVKPGLPQDQELDSKNTDFENFAKWKVRQLNSNHRFSRSRMEIVKQADGTYRARFHEIDASTLSVKVRRSQSRSIPFVGVLSYREQVYESSASTPDHFDKESFAVVEVIPNRHIFSYQKGRWN
jgi:hypothetical protein